MTRTIDRNFDRQTSRRIPGPALQKDRVSRQDGATYRVGFLWVGLAVTLACLGVTSLTVGRASAAPQAEYPILGRVTGNEVNIRTGASTNHRVVSKLTLGSEIIVKGRKNDWLAFHLPPYEKCWIHSDFIRASTEPGRAVITGKSVNLRATPNQTYVAIGRVNNDLVVRTTGRKSDDGSWVQLFAPQEATAYIHKDFVQVVRAITPQDVPHLFAQLRPGVVRKDDPAPAKAGVTEPGMGKPTPKQPTLPANVSPRLREVYKAWETERQKPVIQWTFSSVLQELSIIARESEDTGEAQLASLWGQYIRDYHLPIAVGAREDERKRKEADARQIAGERKEKEASQEITDRPPVGDRHLAKGWVFAMGKNSKVKGTHKLMKGNKLLFYLNSDSVDLDKYVYKRIGVRGSLVNLPKEAGARLIRVSQIEVLSH